MLHSRVSVLVLLVALMAAGSGVFLVAWRVQSLNEQGRQFVDSAIPAITTTWDDDQLFSRATPQFRSSIARRDLSIFGDASAALGAFQQAVGTTGAVGWEAVLLPGAQVSGSYVVKARYAKGLATFQVDAVKIGGAWKIAGFHFDAQTFGSAGGGLFGRFSVQ